MGPRKMDHQEGPRKRHHQSFKSRNRLQSLLCTLRRRTRVKPCRKYAPRQKLPTLSKRHCRLVDLLHNAILYLRTNGIEYHELKLTHLKELLVKCIEDCDKGLRFSVASCWTRQPFSPSFRPFCNVGNWQYLTLRKLIHYKACRMPF